MRILSTAAYSLLLMLAASPACAQTATQSDDATSLLVQAAASFRASKSDEALKLADKAIAADASAAPAYRLRGVFHEALGNHEKAVADFTEAIKRDPKSAEAFDRRGSEQFKLNKIEESIADFDTAIALRPQDEAGHWKRGISYYYAGQFDKGVKQFEGYQTVDDNDVENAVWRYLCMARSQGVPKARAEILKIKDDRRVPMMQVYELYAGRLKPEDVFAAARARAGDPPSPELNNRLFYAHLYLGLYYDAAGDKRQALEHVTKAEEHKIGHYMWDVARVHRVRLQSPKAE